MPASPRDHSARTQRLMEQANSLPAGDESRLSYPGWKIVLAGFFGVMVSFSAIVPYTFSLFLKPLSLAFGWHREAISAGFSVASLTVAVSAPVLGCLLDRFSTRRIILPCIIVFSFAYASLGLLTPHLIQFYAAFFFMGLVGGGTSFLGYSRVVSTWFAHRRGIALSIMIAGSACGAMILPVIAQAAITRYGWRAAFVLLGCLPMVFGFPLTAFFVRDRRTEQRNNLSLEVDEPVSIALRGSIFWIIIATVCLSAIGVGGAIGHLSALLTDRGLSSQGAAYAIAMIGITGLLGRFFVGSLLDRFFGPRVYQTMLLLEVAGIALLAVAHTQTAAILATSLIGFGTGGEADVTPYLIGRYFGLKRLSTLYALTWTSHSIGAAIGPLVIGWLFDSLGSYRTATIQLLALPTLIPCVLMLMLPRYPDRRDSDEPAVKSFAEASSFEILPD